LTVHIRGDAMDCPDERTPTATDHSITNFSAHKEYPFEDV
jgi:hypothetical protein